VTDPQHVEYLLVVLHSGPVMAEEQFDRLALDHLRHFRAAVRLTAIKGQMIAGGHACRLVLRGKPYLARLRLAGAVDNLAVMTVADVGTVLAKVAALAGDPPPKQREYL